MISKAKKIWNAVTTVIVALIVLLAILLVGVRLLGLQVFTVLSGSMEPTYRTGSLIYVTDVDPHTLQTGDVITYMISDTMLVTHRITEVIPDANDPSVVRFRTKGDANDAEDGGTVHSSNVVGKPVFTIPLLGYVSAYIQNPPGTYVAICGVAIFLVLMFLPDVFAKDAPQEPADEPSVSSRRRKGRYVGKYQRRQTRNYSPPCDVNKEKEKFT